MRALRPAHQVLILLGLGLVACAATLLASGRSGADAPAGAALVAGLGLTDLALFTEARYTRHLSQADLHSPFQDHPLGLEHFPSGSLVGPPAHLIESRPPAHLLEGRPPDHLLEGRPPDHLMEARPPDHQAKAPEGGPLP
jgi:hypothetical protein